MLENSEKNRGNRGTKSDKYSPEFKIKGLAFSVKAQRVDGSRIKQKKITF
jgi:hypothetical protein